MRFGEKRAIRGLQEVIVEEDFMELIRGILFALNLMVTFMYIAVSLQTFIKEKNFSSGVLFGTLGIISALNVSYVLKSIICDVAEKVDDIKEERLIRILPSGRQASSVISNNIFSEFNHVWCKSIPSHST